MQQLYAAFEPWIIFLNVEPEEKEKKNKANRNVQTEQCIEYQLYEEEKKNNMWLTHAPTATYFRDIFFLSTLSLHTFQNDMHNSGKEHAQQPSTTLHTVFLLSLSFSPSIGECMRSCLFKYSFKNFVHCHCHCHRTHFNLVARM